MREHPKTIIISAICLLIMFVCRAPCSSGYAADLDERDLKLAFIYNFAKFVQWPPQDSLGPVVFCVLGADTFGGKASAIENKMVGERRIVVRHIPGPEDIKECHILFIPGTEKHRLEQVLRKLKGSSTLTVSDIPDFTRMGGMIGFNTSGNNLRFEINLTAAKASKLEISSKLLKLAESVIGR